MMSEKATNVVVYFVFVVFYGKRHGWKSGVYLFLLGVALVGLTDQVTNLFKNGFMRLRPCHEESLADSMRLVKNSCGGLYSFFSGHSSNSFALAALLVSFLRSKSHYADIVCFCRSYCLQSCVFRCITQLIYYAVHWQVLLSVASFIPW